MAKIKLMILSIAIFFTLGSTTLAKSPTTNEPENRKELTFILKSELIPNQSDIIALNPLSIIRSITIEDEVATLVFNNNEHIYIKSSEVSTAEFSQLEEYSKLMPDLNNGLISENPREVIAPLVFNLSLFGVFVVVLYAAFSSDDTEKIREIKSRARKEIKEERIRIEKEKESNPRRKRKKKGEENE